MLGRILLLAASAAVLVSAQRPRQGRLIPGCTTDSFAIPSWFIHDLQYSSGNGTSKGGKVDFHLLNRATNYTTDMSCQVGSSSWSICSTKGKAWSNNTLAVSVQVVNETSATLLVNQTWTCSDRQGTKP